MTPPSASRRLFAPRFGASLLAMGLALAWAADARASCAGRDHVTNEAKSAASLSPEVVGEPASPLKPSGCSGAFCSRPSPPAGADVRVGVDLRSESWACVTPALAPAVEAGGRIVAVSDELLPSPFPVALIDPPR